VRRQAGALERFRSLLVDDAESMLLLTRASRKNYLINIAANSK
jgi:hypothetical protein